MAVAIEAGEDPLSLVSPLRSEVASIDPDIAITEVGLLGDRLTGSVATERLRFNLIGLFALTAGLLATIGVYGVMAFVVAQRRQEIGIRMALGADRAAVLRQVLRQGLALAAAGTGIGLAVSLATSRLLDSMLFGVSPSDPVTYIAAVSVLVLAALAACYAPARRASGLDPLEALRLE